MHVERCESASWGEQARARGSGSGNDQKPESLEHNPGCPSRFHAGGGGAWAGEDEKCAVVSGGGSEESTRNERRRNARIPQAKIVYEREKEREK